MSLKPEATSTPKDTTPIVETKAKAFNKDQLIKTVTSLQFAWFVGHLTTFISIFFGSLTYVKVGAGYTRFWHLLALVGVIESFGILIFQLVQKDSSNVLAILRNDNSQYFLLSVFLFILRPYVYITLIPFALFSFFHVLVYANTNLLPIAGLEKSGVSTKIQSFISQNNTKSIQLASVVEIYAYGWLLLRLITIRKRSLVPFVVYSIFIKARFESSVFTRNYFKSIEIGAESLINKYAANVPAVKQGWISFKKVLRLVGSFYIVNNYSKDKSI